MLVCFLSDYTTDRCVGWSLWGYVTQAFHNKGLAELAVRHTLCQSAVYLSLPDTDRLDIVQKVTTTRGYCEIRVHRKGECVVDSCLAQVAPGQVPPARRPSSSDHFDGEADRQAGTIWPRGRAQTD